jgi:hypothetical protein
MQQLDGQQLLRTKIPTSPLNSLCDRFSLKGLVDYAGQLVL